LIVPSLAGEWCHPKKLGASPKLIHRESEKGYILGNWQGREQTAELLLILVTSGYFAKVLFCTFTQRFPMAEHYGGELLSQQLLG
jgi:hypothetical protein